MSFKRVLTLCIGISTYPHTVLRPSEKPLRFLATSAADLHAHFRYLWPDGSSDHILLVDQQATFTDALQLVSETQKPYDLFILYLGGHGRNDESGFRFLFYDSTLKDVEIESIRLDSLLGRINATNTLLFLDACHSGKFVEESNYFRAVGSRGNRICLASCLPGQLSWEDNELGHSLFAHALIEKLSVTSPHFISVTDQLLLSVSENVSRHAFGLKRSAAQEPVGGGTLRSVMTLPTGRPLTTRGVQLSTYQVLLRRSRQIGITMAVIIVLATVSIATSTWRPALNESGLIELRAGPKWLSFLNTGPWTLRVETDIKISDLREFHQMAAVKPTVIDEQGTYLWPGNSSIGIRRWADIFITQFLDDQSAARWRVELGYPYAVDELIRTDMKFGSMRRVTNPNATELAAEARILDPEAQISDAWRLDWRDKVVDVPNACKDPTFDSALEDQLGFYLHLSEPQEFASWVEGVALTAASEPEIGLEEVAKLLEMFAAANAVWRTWYESLLEPDEPISARWVSARYSERPKDFEVRGVGRLAEAVVARRLRLGEEPITREEHTRLHALTPYCKDNLIQVLAYLGQYGDPEMVIDWAHGKSKAAQGRIPLLELSKRASLPLSQVKWVLSTIETERSNANGKWAFDNASDWLTRVADNVPLDGELADYLLDFSEDHLNSADQQFAEKAMVIAARTPIAFIGYRKVKFDNILESILNRISPDIPTDVGFELLGLLARSGYPLSVEQKNTITLLLTRETSTELPAVNFTSADTFSPDPLEDLVAGLSATHLLALSRYTLGEGIKDTFVQNPGTFSFFRQAIADGLKLKVKREILTEVVTAAAIAWRAKEQTHIDSSMIVDELRQWTRDGWNRSAIVEIAIHTISDDVTATDTHLRKLREYWHTESEPEVKLAIARTLVGTVKAISKI